MNRDVLNSYPYAKAQCVYHLQWCTKYRYNMLRKDKYKKMYEEILREIAKRHEMLILSLAVNPEHTHVVVSTRPCISQSKALQLFKGGSSYELFRRQPLFRKRYPKGHFWSPGKFARTVGNVDLETTIDYVEKQANQTMLSNFL
ncbi:MAG: IS200/IS605 family transposase [Candidatus Diapherotrites archaeon]